jgi:hypothetical protein
MNDNESRDGGVNLRGLQPRALLNIVCVAGGCVGAFFGLFALPFGPLLGAVGGIVAGLLWTRIMLRRARSGFGRGKLVFAGTGWGIVVGLLATAILHGGLIIKYTVYPQTAWETLSMNPFVLLIAAFCAFVGGAITGAICGRIVPLRE